MRGPAAFRSLYLAAQWGFTQEANNEYPVHWTSLLRTDLPPGGGDGHCPSPGTLLLVPPGPLMPLGPSCP
jgi:hypothetical protein